ncbi:MAG: Cof-type HAD-IIB family hydrolase [Mycoplasmataceae bacterium]|nr:Cof-type HAD-IIB family hydrolase [Mycoplasmataceae bacterium]MBQ5543699.1 Cof-type HAD-IIB family hydrolase [Mycoplasmataceae bacterium]
MRIKKESNEANKYLIVCDLDGTLLDHNSELTPRTKQTVKKIIKMGNIFCIATGRTISSAKKYYEELGLNTLMSNLDGSLISNPSNKNFAPLHFSFSKDILLEIFNTKKIMDKVELAIVETTKECMFINRSKNIDIDKNKELLTFLGFRQDDIKANQVDVNYDASIDEVNNDLYALLFVLHDDKNVDEITNRIRDIAGTLSVISWELKDTKEIVVSISSIFASKQTALKFFSSYYGVKLENCIVFGDSNNDVPMLNKAGYSYAMKNGNMSAKLASKYITRVPNHEDGVALELEKLFYLNECELTEK